MTTPALLFLIFELLGGLALFVFGMQLMTRGLRGAAGRHLRTLLAAATARRAGGFLFGSLLGLLVHSSAASVMLVGFVNAGLMTLGHSIAPVIGANVGTTLSMQVVSLRLDNYSFAAIAVGFLVSIVFPGERSRDAGRALMGFGMLFLGLRVMSGAVQPHREWLAPLLEGVDGRTWGGMAAGLAGAALLTAIIQSSGATIGMCFALISAGVFTRIEQVYPIVLGAHLGTCATALLGSAGTHVDARRTALSHLLFNLFNVSLGLAASPWLMRWIPTWSPDLSRQTAHVHTLVMVLGAAAALPLAPAGVLLLRRLLGRGEPSPVPSYLDRRLLRQPEKALQAALYELRRVLRLTLRSLRLDGELFFGTRRALVVEVGRNEAFINEIKSSLLDYLEALACHYLSRRQIILAQHVSRCMSEVERIGDHIEKIADLCRQRNRYGVAAAVDPDSFRDLFECFRQAYQVVLLVHRSLDPETADRGTAAGAVLQARDLYFEHSRLTQERFAGRVAGHEVSPIAALYFGELLNAIDRIVRHGRIIALAEQHADFWIKRKKLDEPAAVLPEPRPFPPLNPEAYLKQLDADGEETTPTTERGNQTCIHPS